MTETMNIEDYLSQGGVLTSPGNVPARYRGELMRLMGSFVDSELAASAGFAGSINFAPGIKERIAADPYASRFALSGPLRRYGRLKGLGLPDRYRLFFRPFEAVGRRLLLILWLGFPRKDGDRNDCYAVFSRLVQRGELPEDWESLQRELDAG